MKLIDLLVQELPKRGGWPEGAVECERYLHEGNIDFYDADGNWPEDCGEKYGYQFAESLVKERVRGQVPKTEVVTKDEYESALAASTWNGEGLPPVGCEFEYGTHRSVAKCIAVSHHHVFASKGDPDDENSDYEEFLIDIEHSSFYPIRTEVERKREEAEVAMRLCLKGTGCGMTQRTAKIVFDAIAAHQIDGITTVPTVSQIVRCTEKCSREDAERIVAMLKGES